MRARAAEDRERVLIKERDQLLSLLRRWLEWPDRSNDEVAPIERETARALGHSDECELVEYGACTCGKDDVAAPTEQAPSSVYDVLAPTEQAPTSVRGTAKPRTCMACAHCGMAPDDPFPVCGHPDAGLMGLYIKSEPLSHCPDFSKFEQHPGRNPDGTFKP